MSSKLKTGPGSGGVDAPGVLDSRTLPDPEFMELWDAIVVDADLKERLLGHALLGFTLRSKVSGAKVPLHGLILLEGPPGTGKTSLARALAARTADNFAGGGGRPFLFIEVEPHALASASLGKSQRAVRDLLGGTVAEYATRGPLIVLLDEVETLAADRKRLSLEANPVDVHRATDAVLAQLDHLAAAHPNTLFIATSNFPEAIDEALLSRADIVENVGLPPAAACREILASAVTALAAAFPEVKSVLESPEFSQAAQECVGLDGRSIRKCVAAACAMKKESALDPSRMTGDQLLAAVRAARTAMERMKGDRS